MASKDHWKSLKDKPDLALNNSNDLYSNFSLNKNHKCSTAFNHKRSKSIEIGKSSKYESTALLIKVLDVPEKITSQKDSISLKKFHKNLPNDYCNNLNDAKKETKATNLQSSNKTSSSTLSLHIAAYENFVETQNTDMLVNNELQKKKDTTSKALKNFQEQFAASSFIDRFEFPRQQEDKPSTPEVQQFTASQTLFTPIQEALTSPVVRQPAVAQTLEHKKMNDKYQIRSSTPKISALHGRFSFNPPVTPIPRGSNDSNDSSVFYNTTTSMKDENEGVVNDSLLEEKENASFRSDRERSAIGTPTINKLRKPDLFTPQTRKDREFRIQRKHSSNVSSDDIVQQMSEEVPESPMDVSYRKASAPYLSDSDKEESENKFPTFSSDEDAPKKPLSKGGKNKIVDSEDSIIIDDSEEEPVAPKGKHVLISDDSSESGSGKFGGSGDSIIIDESEEERVAPKAKYSINSVDSSEGESSNFGGNSIVIDESEEETVSKGIESKPSSLGSRPAMIGRSKENAISIDSSSDEEVVESKPMVFTAEEKTSVKNLSKQAVLEAIGNLRKIDLASATDGGKKIKRRIALLNDRLNAPFEIEIIEAKPKPAAKFDPEQFKHNDKRLYGGKMTEQRKENIAAASEHAIEHIHGALDAMPENVETATPEDLTCELMLHQKHGLTWMKWRENANALVRGGILADDMGLGKTLSMISLIVSQKADRKNSAEAKEKLTKEMQKRFKDEKDVMASYATLVVAPASVIHQWDKEIKDRVKPGKLKVYLFHGPGRERDPRILARNDVVITTYNTISSELSDEKPLIGHEESEDEGSDDKWYSKVKANSNKKVISKRNKKSVLTQIGWERIILDEAHNIKNRNSLMSKGCCRLFALKRWALTGTPIHNKLWDFYSLIKFLRISPFCDQGYWKMHMSDMSSKTANERLNALVKSILIRRTKNQLCPVTQKPLVNLKPRTFELVEIQLEGIEDKCYQQMMEASKQKAKELINNQGEQIDRRRRKGTNVVKNPFVTGNRDIDLDDNFQMMSCLLVLLLRLRQACVHMALTKQAVDLDAFKEDGGDDSINEMDELEKTFGNISLGAEDSIAKENRAIDEIFEPTHVSGKLKVLLERVDKVIESGDKCVIISQWTSMLDIIKQHLTKKRRNLTEINGKVLPKDRQERINSFNQKNGGAQIMLLSLTAGGVGLNLVGGNHLFLVDLHWNPALEAQACDRIYRVGQSKDVFIHKLICKDTIEQRVLQLQAEKTQIATSVLEGAAKKFTKLSVNDMKFLFGLRKDQQQPQPSAAPKAPYGPNNVRTHE